MSIVDWKMFQEHARVRMGVHFQIALDERQPSGSPKRFDFVSPAEDIVGDAKYLTLVRGVNLPPAKFMEIAGHVWLLERLPCPKRRFLVFGNQRRVPEWWLEKYGTLVTTVEFYFLAENGTLDQLK